jgi:uncharacterized membrane protein YtjA (UPF0391 family)
MVVMSCPASCFGRDVAAGTGIEQGRNSVHCGQISESSTGAGASPRWNPCQFRKLEGGFRARPEELAVTLLKWALIFFVISIIAGILGFTGISAASADIARILFYIFVVIFLVLLILGLTIFRV